jgi:hypothetical protein
MVMNCKKVYGLVVLFITLNATTIIGQSTNSAYTPKIIPPSPNAASIAKFGDIPVSPYTGTSDVSIPIYTIQAKGVSVPVTLDYHTGGIRLNEESGWVGLGWALNAGGMISRTINDKDDFLPGYFNSSVSYPLPEAKGRLLPYQLYPSQPYLGNWGYEFACNYKVHTEFGDVDYLSAFKQAFSSVGTYDFEPDTYSFNFLGKSGKFIIGRDGKVILQRQENLKIEFATNGSSFTITDDRGNKYYFLDKEYTQPATGGASSTSSWMLSKIITQQRDSIIFHYSTDSTWSTVKGISHEVLRKGVADETPNYSNDPGTNYLNQTLQYIDYDNCQVQFSFDGNRTDLQNGKKLNNVKIYSKDRSGLKYLKEDQLYYSYFNSGFDPLEFTRLKLDSVKEVSGILSLPPYVFTYNLPPNNQNLSGKHYSSVDHWGYFNGVSNALNGNYTLGFTPPFYGIATLHGVSQLVNLPGANREPDAGYMQSFSLNQVTYPTGGYSVFEYEPNYYDYANSIAGREGRDYEQVALQTQVIQIPITTRGNSSGTVDLSDIYFTSSSISNATMSIGFVASRSDSLNYYHQSLGYGKINFTFQNNTTDISDAGLQCSGSINGSNCTGLAYSASRALIIPSASKYSWSAYIDPKVTTGFSQIQVTITYQTPKFRHSTMLMAGGLRIKSIRDYAANGKLAKKRIYDYTYQQDKDGDGVKETYSFGRLMGYLSYARNELIYSTSFPNFSTSLTRYSSSFSAFTSQSSGNIVGYDQVTEYTIDSASGADNGKTVYKFYNSADTTFSYSGYRFPGVLNLPNNLNGLPRSRSFYTKTENGNGYNRVSSTDYYYHAVNRIMYDAFKWYHVSTSNALWRNDPTSPVPCTTDTHGNYISSGCNCPTHLDTAGFQLTTNFYPVISSEAILLDSTVETMSDQKDTTIQIKTTTRNYYDNPKHYQLTRSSITDSKGNTHVSFIRYPQDYLPVGGGLIGNTVLDSMIQKNMLSLPVEKRDSLYLSGSSGGLIRGAEVSLYKLLSPDKIIAPDKQYKLDLPSTINNLQPVSFSGNTVNKDSRYRQIISFDSYDSNYNTDQYTTVDQLPVSFIWDYFKKYPVAQVKNATTSQIAYTSFEADGKGNWTFTGVPIADGTAPTGAMVYPLSNGAISKSGLDASKTFVISFWAKAQPAVSNLTLVKTGETIGAWTYYEYKTNASVTSVNISGTTYIDELRQYPVDAQMTTYTYAPQIGISSVCDVNSRISYYEYDLLGRLNLVRDQDRNVVKKYCYNYAGQPSACEGVVYYNTTASQVFTRNNCAAGKVAGSATYTIPANKYFSIISQVDADQQAQADIAANGQNYANANATCTDPPLINVTYTNSTSAVAHAELTNIVTHVTYYFTINTGSTNVIASQQIPQGTYDAYIYSDGSGSYFMRIYTFSQMGVKSIHAYNLSLCSTCASISVTN